MIQPKFPVVRQKWLFRKEWWIFTCWSPATRTTRWPRCVCRWSMRTWLESGRGRCYGSISPPIQYRAMWGRNGCLLNPKVRRYWVLRLVKQENIQSSFFSKFPVMIGCTRSFQQVGDTILGVAILFSSIPKMVCAPHVSGPSPISAYPKRSESRSDRSRPE